MSASTPDQRFVAAVHERIKKSTPHLDLSNRVQFPHASPMLFNQFVQTILGSLERHKSPMSAILEFVDNAISAGATCVKIDLLNGSVGASAARKRMMVLEIRDDGRGLPPGKMVDTMLQVGTDNICISGEHSLWNMWRAGGRLALRRLGKSSLVASVARDNDGRVVEFMLLYIARYRTSAGDCPWSVWAADKPIPDDARRILSHFLGDIDNVPRAKMPSAREQNRHRRLATEGRATLSSEVAINAVFAALFDGIATTGGSCIWIGHLKDPLFAADTDEPKGTSAFREPWCRTPSVRTGQYVAVDPDAVINPSTPGLSLPDIRMPLSIAQHNSKYTKPCHPCSIDRSLRAYIQAAYFCYALAANDEEKNAVDVGGAADTGVAAALRRRARILVRGAEVNCTEMPFADMRTCTFKEPFELKASHFFEKLWILNPALKRAGSFPAVWKERIDRLFRIRAWGMYNRGDVINRHDAPYGYHFCWMFRLVSAYNVMQHQINVTEKREGGQEHPMRRDKFGRHCQFVVNFELQPGSSFKLQPEKANVLEMILAPKGGVGEHEVITLSGSPSRTVYDDDDNDEDDGDDDDDEFESSSSSSSSSVFAADASEEKVAAFLSEYLSVFVPNVWKNGFDRLEGVVRKALDALLETDVTKAFTNDVRRRPIDFGANITKVKSIAKQLRTGEKRRRAAEAAAVAGETSSSEDDCDEQEAVVDLSGDAVKKPKPNKDNDNNGGDCTFPNGAFDDFGALPPHGGSGAASDDDEQDDDVDAEKNDDDAFDSIEGRFALVCYDCGSALPRDLARNAFINTVHDVHVETNAWGSICIVCPSNCSAPTAAAHIRRQRTTALRQVKVALREALAYVDNLVD